MEKRLRAGLSAAALAWRHPIAEICKTHNIVRAKSVVASVRANDGQTKLFIPCPTTTVFGTTDTAYQAAGKVEL